MSDDLAPIPIDAWPAEFRPFEGNSTAEERAEWARLHDERRASKSAPQPDDPDNRTNGREPASVNEKVVRQATRTTPGQTPELALEEDILALFLDDFRRAGVVGEERLGQLVYLSLTSRMLAVGPAAAVRPVSVLPKGTTSTGKSHATSTTLRFFPESAYFPLGSFSRRYLFYEQENVRAPHHLRPRVGLDQGRRGDRRPAPRPALRGAHRPRHGRRRGQADGDSGSRRRARPA